MNGASTNAGNPNAALRFALEGERVRKASGVLEREALPLATALRRAVPFLSRRGVPVTLSYARATPISDLVAELPRPLYVVSLMAEAGERGSGRGAIVVDATAVAAFIDGALGGDGTTLPELDAAGLSSAQTALMARVARGIVEGFSEVLAARAGIRLRAASPDAGDAETEGAPIACALEMKLGEKTARVVLLLPKELLLSGVPAVEAAPAVDNRVEAVLADVELEIVAELGRVPMRLSTVADLKVGDTLRFDLAVGAPVTVRADGKPLATGRPSASGGRIVVRIDR